MGVYEQAKAVEGRMDMVAHPARPQHWSSPVEMVSSLLEAGKLYCLTR